jgi:hypothetical protein
VHNYYFKLEVKGRGRFPLDQLRRYELFPIYIDTVAAIEASFDEPKFERTYHLGFYASSLGADAAVEARFASFGFVSKTLELWRGGKLYYKDGEPVADDGKCLHGGYIMKLDSMGEEKPFCPACDEELEL